MLKFLSSLYRVSKSLITLFCKCIGVFDIFLRLLTLGGGDHV